MGSPTEWTAEQTAGLIRAPAESDDKYSRGVLGVLAGSERYPGAAVLVTEAALRTGLGMLRYHGPERATELVLQRRPEAVTAPGRVQAWLLGPGMDAADLDPGRLRAALAEPVPMILDAGALELYDQARGPVVLTPHHGELARVMKADAAELAARPSEWARIAADELGVTVLLKGHTTVVAGPGVLYSVTGAPSWLATAGAGDALAGILGALVATNAAAAQAEPAELARLAAGAAFIHGAAAARASAGGPLTVLDLCAAIPATIAGLLAGRA